MAVAARPRSQHTGWQTAGALLRRRPYRLLVGGQLLGQAASGLVQVAFAQILLFEIGAGATPWEIAKFLMVSFLPFALVGPFAGVLIDRYDRRRVMVVVSLLFAAVAGASVVVLVVESPALAYLATFFLLSCSRLVLAAKGAALPNTAGNADLVTANAVSALAGVAATALGFVFGATFVEAAPAAGLVIAAAGYLGAAAVFARLPNIGGGGVTEPIVEGLRRITAEMVEGIRYAAVNEAVRRPLLAVVANRMLLGAGVIVLVLIADARYDFEASGYAVAIILGGAGAFVGTWLAPWLGRRFHRITLLPLTFLFGAGAAALGAFSPTFGMLVFGVVLAACGFQILKLMVDSLLQEASPDRVRGRVFAIYDVLYNLAFILAGLALIPIWALGREGGILWVIGVAFLAFGLALAWAQRSWPFQLREAPPRPRHRWRNRGLALLAGSLPALAFPEPSIWLLGIVGLVPLMWLVCSAPNGRESVWRVWLGGIGFFIAVHHWLIPVTGPFVVPLAMVLAILWIPWGGLLWVLLGRTRSTPRLAAAVLIVPSAWVVGEYLRSWDRLGGPWGLLGATQWQNLTLLAVVSIGGVWLLSFLLVAINVAITAALFPQMDGGRRVAALGVAVILLAAGYATSLTQPEVDPSGSFAVAGVQPGQVEGGTARIEAHEALTRSLIGRDLDLVVWAESSVSVDLEPGSERLERIQGLSEDVGAPILLNVDSRRGEGGIFKASVLVDSNGIADRYDKMRLVPFGEYVPIRPVFGWVNSLTDAADEDRKRGESLVLMDVDGVTIGPLVCFESAFPDLSRHLVDRGADVIVLQTATTTFQGSWAQPQHASLAAVRAVETSRPVVHAALSGVSAVFGADGSRMTSLGSSAVGTWQATPGLTTGTTIYVRTGDWVPILSLVILLGGIGALGLHAARRRPRTAAADAASPSEDTAASVESST